MAAKSPDRRRLSGTVAALEKHNGPDDPRIAPLRDELAAARSADELADWTRRAAIIPAFDQADIAQVGVIAARLDARIRSRQAAVHAT
jgi:hypothetical protein